MKSPLQNAIERKQFDKIDGIPPAKLNIVKALKIKIESHLPKNKEPSI